MLKPD